MSKVMKILEKYVETEISAQSLLLSVNLLKMKKSVISEIKEKM